MVTISKEYIKEKWLHAGFQKHFKNTSWMFLAKFASMAITFIATAIIARNLGPTNYGELSYAVSFVSIFGFLASLGIDQILYRDLIKFPEKRNEYMGTSLILRLIAGIMAVVVCSVLAFFISPKDVSLLLIFIVSLTMIFNSFQLLGYEFQAEVNSKKTSILTLIVIFILNILKIIVIVFNQGVIYLAAVILIEPVLYGIGLLYLRVKEYGTIKNWRFDKKIAVSLLKDSFPLIFASAFFAIYARIDQIMIKNMLDAQSVGLYDSAVRISEMWYFIPNIIVAALFPAIINAKKSSEELYFKRFKKLTIFILSLSVLVALATTFLSKYLILIIFGGGFLGALTVLQIYVWSNIGAALNLLIQQFLVAENLTKIISINTFFGMITNILLNLVLIPEYGMAGAAFASFISYFIPFFSLFLFKKTRKILSKIIQ